MQYGIEKKCESIVGVFDNTAESVFPIEYDSNFLGYSMSRKSSLATKINHISNLFNDVEIYTANDYVKDGLVALYDAKENIGYGQHSNSATTWKNLVYESSHSTDLIVNSSGGVAVTWWEDDCVNLPGTDEFAHSTYNMVNGIAIECCFKLQDISEGEEYADGYCPFSIGNASTAWVSDRRRIIVYPRESGMYVNTYQKYIAGTPETAESKYSYWVDSNPSGIKTIYTYMTTCDFTPENQSFYVNSSDFSTAYCSSGESFPEQPWSRYGDVIRVGLNAWASDTPSLPFKGKIYSIRIYNRNLTREEVNHNDSVDRQRYSAS